MHSRAITIQKAWLGPEAGRIDREYWTRLTPDERVETAWQISLELWWFKGWDTGEQRLHRAVTRLIRG